MGRLLSDLLVAKSVLKVSPCGPSQRQGTSVSFPRGNEGSQQPHQLTSTAQLTQTLAAPGGCGHGEAGGSWGEPPRALFKEVEKPQKDF